MSKQIVIDILDDDKGISVHSTGYVTVLEMAGVAEYLMLMSRMDMIDGLREAKKNA